MVFASAESDTVSGEKMVRETVAGLSLSRRCMMRLAIVDGLPIAGKVDRSPVGVIPSSSSKTLVGNRSIATTSALAISPAVKMLLPLRPFPVSSSGRSPLTVRRMQKNRLGTLMANNPFGSMNVFISTGFFDVMTVVSSACTSTGEMEERSVAAVVVFVTADARERRKVLLGP
mmetsp:Transcript_7996/g.11416  ORF Transcript_7996/g.11416 Transcript_7996/m.11416 type:complete len:173 (+) Transcript_7996:284-802(+)